MFARARDAMATITAPARRTSRPMRADAGQQLVRPALPGRGLAAASPMIALRCTRKLLTRIGRAPSASDEIPPPGTTVLGDWYATAFVVARRPLVLAVAERTLCPVVLPLREARTLVPRWCEAVGRKLRALGVAAAQIEAELAAMADVALGPASYRVPAARRVVGVLTDMVYHCEPHVVHVHPGPGLAAAGLTLPETFPDLAGMEAALDRLPCAPLGYATPAETTWALFAAAREQGSGQR